MMEWTAEQDTQLTELFKRRLGIRFISSWTRWPAPAIRTRLVELGLTAPLQPRSQTPSSAPGHASSISPPVRRMRELAEIADGEEDETDFRSSRGCPRGYLLSEAQIAALYRGAGRDYR